MNSSFNSRYPPTQSARNQPTSNAYGQQQRGSNFMQEFNQYPQSNPTYNNSFSNHYPQDMPQNPARNNWSHQQNYSQEYEPNFFNNSFNNSFASQADRNHGVPEVGRFGGLKKKMREQCNDSFQSNTKSKNSGQLKVKQPTIKEQASQNFYFPICTIQAKPVTCPFNPNHMMEEDRLLTHINKCKLKSENAKYFSVCPFDPTHYYYTSEIDAHILVCDKRHLFVVMEAWEQGPLETSTVSSIPITENEVIQGATKAPSSKFQNEDKRLYEQFLIDP